MTLHTEKDWIAVVKHSHAHFEGLTPVMYCIDNDSILLTVSTPYGPATVGISRGAMANWLHQADTLNLDYKETF